jgi:hypothetical protein
MQTAFKSTPAGVLWRRWTRMECGVRANGCAPKMGENEPQKALQKGARRQSIALWRGLNISPDRQKKEHVVD